MTKKMKHIVPIALLALSGCYQPYETHYPSGALEERGHREFDGFLCGRTLYKYDGKYEVWWSNGKKRCDFLYHSGVSDGVFTTWFENGNLSQQVPYKNGVHQGKYTIYYESGGVSTTGTFVNDAVTEALYYDKSGHEISRHDWQSLAENRDDWDKRP